MSDVIQTARIQSLEAENARLSGLLDAKGMPGTLRHQVRNALGLMRAIIRRSMDGKTSIEDYAAHLEGRFDALLRVQTALLSSPDGRVDLASLISNELMAHTIGEGYKAAIEGPSLRLQSRQAELLGLVFHELAVNALKFGDIDAAAYHIDVTWVITPSDDLNLVWLETSGRMTAPRLGARGFGTEAIEAMLPYQLMARGRLECLSEGIRCTLELPLASAWKPGDTDARS